MAEIKEGTMNTEYRYGSIWSAAEARLSPTSMQWAAIYIYNNKRYLFSDFDISSLYARIVSSKRSILREARRFISNGQTKKTSNDFRRTRHASPLQLFGF
jgi:hypothetical protein